MAKKPVALLAAEKAAQWRFLQEVSRTAPQVLEHLLTKVAPLYRDRYEQSGLDQQLLYRLVLTQPDERIESALREWQSDFRLEASWIRYSAHETLRCWVTDPSKSATSFEWNYNIATLTPDLEHPELERQFEFVFRHPGWNPFLENWKHVEEGIKDDEYAYGPGYPGGIRPEFEKALKGYRQRLEKLAAEYGFPVHTAYTVDDNWYYCLVRYQVCEIPFVRLRDDRRVKQSKLSTKYITDAVKSLAKFIGLPLRQTSKGGRPPTTTGRRGQKPPPDFD